MNYRSYLKIFTLLGASTLSSIAGNTPLHADTPMPPQVVIKNFMFQPMTVTMKAGTSLTWVNRDEEPHTVTSENGLFRSGAMDTNETFTFKFDKPGTYHFLCSIHPQMVGTIVVE
jgi:plastocyanin